MAYSDYGAFVYFNGKRRTDKEDVGVYDTDEASLPSGLRVFANIMKRDGGGEWQSCLRVAAKMMCCLEALMKRFRRFSG